MFGRGGRAGRGRGFFYGGERGKEREARENIQNATNATSMTRDLIIGLPVSKFYRPRPTRPETFDWLISDARHTGVSGQYTVFLFCRRQAASGHPLRMD